ncbi:MAG: family intrarane metalloprotease [Rhodoglobus sp.]|nr:family intrarane metalloprotease [Rhodoglobus sp.]
MLDPTWALTRPLLWVALAAMLVLLIVRSVRKDRREYQRFKRYRTTRKRQEMFRKWLLESFLTFAGLTVAVLLLAGQSVGPLLQELTTWPVLRDIRGAIAHDAELVMGVTVGIVIGAITLTLIGVAAARKEQDLPTIGDIRSMLPRNRQELLLGGLLSINAGVFEELLFRLALPALVFGATGSAVAAVLASVLLFGALHAYQGPAGIIGTTIVGALMMGLYIVTGTIVAPIILHALFDLRSLVLLPIAVFGAHRVDGTKHPIAVPFKRVEPPAPAEQP